MPLFLFQTKRLSVDFECTTRNLAFCLVFKIYHEVLGAGNEVVDFIFENVRTCIPLIVIRLMKVLKTFLYMATFGRLNLRIFSASYVFAVE